MKGKTTIQYISQLYDIVRASNQCHHPVRIKQGPITVDGRSILGILSLDLFRPIYIHVQDKEELEKFDAFMEWEDEDEES